MQSLNPAASELPPQPDQKGMFSPLFRAYQDPQVARWLPVACIGSLTPAESPLLPSRLLPVFIYPMTRAWGPQHIL
jgi:hypothetical protein